MARSLRTRRRWRDPAKERRWRQLMRDWRMSGLSIRQFCSQHGVSQPSFYVWRRELAKRDQEAAERRRHAASRRSRPAPAFLPVQVVASAPDQSERSGCLEVQLPTNVLLRIPSGFDRQTLTDVLAALESATC